ncbi:site-specific integrase [Umezawaea sp. Da 62-37]|uniref:tyrosine-type recombinase/integrase n=1 Tax=Umezawaea sp. Da 62-37 TaxID=3075927 RepID=UPI0028F706D2|nr:site-specific integrase [Umezawaea sp. Da 62-37]WNV84920.1 site-specific integrase [Umezawaea sp. Da 62-37]
MRSKGDQRDLSGLVLPETGQLVATGKVWEPYRLIDADGAVVIPVAEYFAELQALDASTATVYSYGNDLLRWWRFLHAVDVVWNRAVQVEARDFMRWMRIADKPVRTHWRRREDPAAASRAASPPVGRVNPVTGKAAPGRKYAASTRAHAETVLRAFYDYHRDAGTGPIINPFPLDRSRRAGRPNAHHNPLDPFVKERTGRYRPRTPRRIPKRIPDDVFTALFSGLKYHRDRALLAFWVSTAARAEELLTVPQRYTDPGEQLIGVIRKGSGAFQWLPASPDAFVWLRLYQQEMWRKGAPQGRQEPLWCTLRRPWRPLAYPAAREMLNRAQALLGSNYSLHDLRHTGAYRMAHDPEMPITDVQLILGHASLSTTQLYTTPTSDDVIAGALAHHRRRAEGRTAPPPVPPVSDYNPDSLRVLFGHQP